MVDEADEPHAFLLEFNRIGNQVRVSATDSETGIEAVIIAPANSTRKQMIDSAVRKLRYLLAKESKT